MSAPAPVADLSVLQVVPEPDDVDPTEATAPEVTPPAVTGIRVHFAFARDGVTRRDHPHACTWWLDAQDGTLCLDDQWDRTIAEYAPGHWQSVEDLFGDE